MPLKPPLEARHHPSGLNDRFEGDGLTFADYAVRTYAMLAAAHARLGTRDAQLAIECNAPFELMPVGDPPVGHDKPYRRGVLLVHGLTDSPYFMRPLGHFFAAQGFRVMAPLLPGHGTQPGDLLHIHWREWARAVTWGVERLAEEVDELYLAGYSAGVALALHHSRADVRVRGLFLFSPALKISPRAAWANLHRRYSWLLPTAAWHGIRPDYDLCKYESFPKNAAAQMHALIRNIGGYTPEVPVFVAASADDTTVDVTATLELVARLPNPASRMVLYTTAPQTPLPGITPERVMLVDSRVPEQRILSSAHTAIVLPPDDPRYGKNGTYCSCAHYFSRDMEKYAACRQHPEQAWQGELTEANLRLGVLRRLMYNPHYAALENSMRMFMPKEVSG